MSITEALQKKLLNTPIYFMIERVYPEPEFEQLKSIKISEDNLWELYQVIGSSPANQDKTLLELFQEWLERQVL